MANVVHVGYCKYGPIICIRADIVNVVLYFVYDGYCNYSVYDDVFLYGENTTHCISKILINGNATKKIDSEKVIYLKWFKKC